MKIPLFGRKKAPEIPETRPEPVISKRSYRAAYSHRLAKGFNVFGSVSPREETRRELRGLVSHARHAAHNFDHARAYEMLVRRHVIGPSGIRLQMNVTELDGRRDLLANTVIETAWRKWGRKGSPSICGRLSFWGIECQIAAAMIPPGKNAKWMTTSPGAVAQNEYLRISKYLGRAIWRRWRGYHRRSWFEPKMSCNKRHWQTLMARDFERLVAELQFRIAVLNGYTVLGIPLIVAVE